MADNVQVIRSAYEAFARGDVPAVPAILDEDVEWEVTDVLPQGGSFRGRDGAGEFSRASEEPGKGSRLRSRTCSTQAIMSSGSAAPTARCPIRGMPLATGSRTSSRSRAAA